MASWRCPHCDAPQSETERCWVCGRSTRSCATCRQFRRAVAAQIGYCALGKARSPLAGDEERVCWEEPSSELAGPGRPTRRATVKPSDPGRPGLWGGAPPAVDSSDAEEHGLGMWTESDSIVDAAPGHPASTGSIRARPWGPVPGSQELSGWRRGIRAIKKS